MPVQLCLPRPVWWQTVPRGVPKYGEQTEIHTYFIWSRRISFVFHLYSKKHRRMEDRWMAKLELLQTPHKHLHHSVPLGNISRALWDRSQGNLSRYSGKGTEVVNSEKQPNHPLKYSSLLQHKNSQAVLCALTRLPLPPHTDQTSSFPVSPHCPAHSHQTKAFPSSSKSPLSFLGHHPPPPSSSLTSLGKKVWEMLSLHYGEREARARRVP